MDLTTKPQTLSTSQKKDIHTRVCRKLLDVGAVANHYVRFNQTGKGVLKPPIVEGLLDMKRRCLARCGDIPSAFATCDANNSGGVSIYEFQVFMEAILDYPGDAAGLPQW